MIFVFTWMCQCPIPCYVFKSYPKRGKRTNKEYQKLNPGQLQASSVSADSTNSPFLKKIMQFKSYKYMSIFQYNCIFFPNWFIVYM